MKYTTALEFDTSELKTSNLIYNIKTNEHYDIQNEITKYLNTENPRLKIQGFVYDPWYREDLEDILKDTAYRVSAYTPNRFGLLQMCGRPYVRFTAILRLIGLHDL